MSRPRGGRRPYRAPRERVNGRIRAREVRLLADDGKQLGVYSIQEAMRMAMEHRLDQRSDLFSVGTVLFHAVSGELPFTGSNPSVILRNIFEGNRADVQEVAPDTSPELADAVERLLQTEPADRFQTAGELCQALSWGLQEVGGAKTDLTDRSDPSDRPGQMGAGAGRDGGKSDRPSAVVRRSGETGHVW